MKEKRTLDHPESRPTANVKKEPSIWDKLLPHLAALTIFIIIEFIFFGPMITGDKILSQSDMIQYKGMSKEIADFRAATGEEPLWTNAMFSGMPAFQISVDYKGNLLRYIVKVLSLGFFPHPTQLLFIALICFYIFLLTLRVNPWIAIAGAIAYALSAYNLTLLEAGHTSKLHAMGLLPIAVAGILMLRNGKYLWGFIVSAIGLSLQVYANHLQISYYLFLMMLIYGVVEIVYAIKNKETKSLLMSGGLIITAAVFAVITNLSMLWSTAQYAPSTIRGPSELTSNKQSTGGLDIDYAFAWSYGKMESFTMLIPNFYGGSSGTTVKLNSNAADVLRKFFNVKDDNIESFPARSYWGDVAFTSGPVYLGALVCFLFLLSMLVLKEKWKWWLLTTVVVALVMSWGRNFMAVNEFLFHHMPGFNRFRTPSMILILVQFCAAFSGFYVLSKIIKGEYEKQWLIKQLKYALYVTGGLCLLFAVAGSMLFSFEGKGDGQFQQYLLSISNNNNEFAESMMSAIEKDRAGLLRTDAVRSLIIIVAGGGLIWLFLLGKIKQTLLFPGLILITLVDLGTVGKRYLNLESNFEDKNKYDRHFQPTEINKLIAKETSVGFRVLNLAVDPFTDSKTSLFHHSVGGYHAAKLRRYQDLIEHQLTQDSTGRPFNQAVIDMLNTKYIIFKRDEEEKVAPNTGALDNAWFVDSILIVNNADEEMAALNSFDPSHTVVIDKRFEAQVAGLKPSFDSTATILVETYQLNHLVYRFHSAADNILVFSEIYYQPGWNSFIDGKPGEHFRCNYILRGMKVPAGDHTIEFRFEPKSFFTGEKIAMAGSGLIWLVVVAGIIIWWRKRESVKASN